MPCEVKINSRSSLPIEQNATHVRCGHDQALADPQEVTDKGHCANLLIVQHLSWYIAASVKQPQCLMCMNCHFAVSLASQLPVFF